MLGNKMSVKEKSVFLTALAECLDMGLDYVQIFAYLKHSFSRYIDLLENMEAIFTEKGTWTDALSLILDEKLIPAVRTGEDYGNLKDALLQVKKYYDLQSSIKAAFTRDAVYIGLFLFLLIAIFYGVVLFAMPKFKYLFKLMPPGAQIPSATKALLTLSDFFLHHKIFIPLSLLGLILFMYALYLQLKPYLNKAPFISFLYGMQEFVTGTYLLAVLYDSGVLLDKAINSIIDSFKGPFRAVLEKALYNVELGESLPLSKAVEEFDKQSAIIIAVGERTQNLSQYLHRASDQKRKTLEQKLHNLSVILSFLIPLIGAGMIVAFYALTVLPLYTCLGQVG